MAERFHEAPLRRGLAHATAAEVMLVLAALREENNTTQPAPSELKPKVRSLRQQTRVDRKVLLALAQQGHETVWDVKERSAEGW